MSDVAYVKWVQSRLTSHGFPPGEVDGVFGDDTRKAVLAFQIARGIAPSPTVNEVTRIALRSTSSAEKAVPEREGPVIVRSAFPRQANVEAFYGKPGENLVAVQVPYDMRLSWDRSAVVRRITVNQGCAESLRLVLETIADMSTAGERARIGVDLFGGSYNHRRMRGGSKLSMHAYGIALDFDPERNGLHWSAKANPQKGTPGARLAQSDAVWFWDVWERAGWVSLGRERDFDWMHVQAARL